jgi:type IV pilus assembly protein PilB
VKILSNMKIDENRMPQDGRFRSKILDREIDFRVSTFPTPLGEKVAIRILDPQTGLKSFEKLGFAGSSFERVKHGLQRPYGMVLVTGPTGSGKSTTLYALLQQLNNEDVNIVSLEDPVEYFVAGVNQSQVHPEIGYDFANGLREILRQDPDIIMVGEIRDAETAGLAVNAALTGHIVLSTLHTNNAAGVIPRLIDMKVEPFLLPSALSLMIAQRLVSEICQNCKEAVEAPPQIQEMITRALVGVPREEAPFDAPYKIWHSRGCEVCHGRGITGRRALHEVLEMTPAFERIINEGPTAQKIIAEAKRQGMLTMRQDGVAKALNGLILMEEVLR